MKTIREGVFETNSSSMHAFVVPNNGWFHKKDDLRHTLTADYDMDFSARHLVLRDKPTEKASYLFHLINNKINSMLHSGEVLDWKKNKRVKLTKEQRSENKFVIKMYKHWLEYFTKLFLDEYNVLFEEVNYKIVDTPYEAVIDSTEFSSTGCYGHGALNELIHARLFEYFDDTLKSRKLPKTFDECKYDELYFASMPIMSFILDENGAFIQCTDECTEAERKRMHKLIEQYAKKNKFHCHIVWPWGG